MLFLLIVHSRCEDETGHGDGHSECDTEDENQVAVFDYSTKIVDNGNVLCNNNR